MITVQELIDALERFPRNMPVLADGYDSGYEEALLPEIIRVKREPENMYYEGEYQSAEASDEAAIEVVAVFRNRRYDLGVRKLSRRLRVIMPLPYCARD